MIYLGYYNPSQMEKMQKDALDRVNEMHKRSKQMVQGFNPGSKTEQKPSSQKKQDFNSKPQSHTSPAPDPSYEQHKNPQPDIFGAFLPNNSEAKTLSGLWDFKIDEEKALIAIIIYILAKNNADPKLLVGLGYLLL